MRRKGLWKRDLLKSSVTGGWKNFVNIAQVGFERFGWLEALLTDVALVQRLRIPFVDFSNVFMESCECTSGELASIYLRRMNHKSSAGGKSENSWTHLTKVPQLIGMSFNMLGQIWFWFGTIVFVQVFVRSVKSGSQVFVQFCQVLT